MLFPTCLKWTQFARPSIHSDPKVFIPLILIIYYCLGDQVVVLSLVVGRSGSGSAEKSRVVCDPAVHPFCQQSTGVAGDRDSPFFFQLLFCLGLGIIFSYDNYLGFLLLSSPSLSFEIIFLAQLYQITTTTTNTLVTGHTHATVTSYAD